MVRRIIRKCFFNFSLGVRENYDCRVGRGFLELYRRVFYLISMLCGFCVGFLVGWLYYFMCVVIIIVFVFWKVLFVIFSVIEIKCLIEVILGKRVIGFFSVYSFRV